MRFEKTKDHGYGVLNDPSAQYCKDANGNLILDGERRRFGLNAQYSFSQKFSVYASIANIGGFAGGNLRYSPTTPDYMQERRRQEFPATFQIGVKGPF